MCSKCSLQTIRQYMRCIWIPHPHIIPHILQCKNVLPPFFSLIHFYTFKGFDVALELKQSMWERRNVMNSYKAIQAWFFSGHNYISHIHYCLTVVLSSALLGNCAGKNNNQYKAWNVQFIVNVSLFLERRAICDSGLLLLLLALSA